MVENTIEHIISEHSRSNSHWLSLTALDSNSQPIGFIDARIVPSKKLAEIEAPMDSKTELRQVASEDGFYVIPSQRGNGIGSKLFKELLTTLKKEGIEYLYIIQPTPESVDFYKKYGGQGEAQGVITFVLGDNLNLNPTERFD